MLDKSRADTIRAFIALDLESTSLRRVARVSDRLRMASGAPSATWVRVANMHVTLKFMGELPSDAATPLAKALGSLVEGRAAPAACRFRLAAFPELETAHVVVAELEDTGGQLARLSAEVSSLALELGVQGEQRAFRPHITLARLKRPYDARRWLRGELAEEAGECRASALTLYESELGSAGAKHTPLAKYLFA
ncbi:MAG: RNA 2',3'-cyclic phosphodiesterase [Polyangiaceae bacterium]